MNEQTRIGIMGAMPEEIDGVVGLLDQVSRQTLGGRIYYSGEINKVPVVVVFSRWGKVAAAATVAALIHEFKITELIFTGVAGGIHPHLNIGDIVLGERLIQHDMDARPLMQQYEIPLLGQTFFEVNAESLARADGAVNQLLESKRLHQIFSADILAEFKMSHPRFYRGDIASGDRFFAGHEHKVNLQTQLPTVLCVEMEGAAVAQVCFEYQIPYVVIRTISDVADEQSHLDFPRFIKYVSSKYSVEIIKNILSVA